MCKRDTVLFVYENIRITSVNHYKNKIGFISLAFIVKKDWKLCGREESR
jgi:hypothetical protein